MKCPKCTYEPTMAEQADSPGICPRCGVVYSKVVAQQIKSAEPVTAETSNKSSKEQRRQQETEEWHKRMDAAAQRRIVITDIDIPFDRLVMVMTKMILAALPALFIASLILTVIGTVLVGVIRSFF